MTNEISSYAFAFQFSGSYALRHMNKTDHGILLFLSLLFAALVGINLWMGMSIGKLSTEMSRQQEVINRANQLGTVLENLAQRIARGSEADPRLLEILKKNNLQVTLEDSGQTKNYP